MASGCMMRICKFRRIRFPRLPTRDLIVRVRMNFPAHDPLESISPPRETTTAASPIILMTGRPFRFSKLTVSGGLRGFGDLEEFRLAEVGAEDLQADGEIFSAIEIRGAAGDGDARDAGEVGGEGENIR
jgi:hypothetical protein